MEAHRRITIQANTFRSVNKTTCTLMVPKGCVDKYKSNDYWKEFSNIIENPTTNIDFNKSNEISVYSTKTNIVVNGTSTYEKIDVYNISGNLLKSIKANNERTTIRMKENALYILKIEKLQHINFLMSYQ